MDTRLAMNGILKDFVKKGDSELSEINLFGWNGGAELLSKGRNYYILFYLDRIKLQEGELRVWYFRQN